MPFDPEKLAKLVAKQTGVRTGGKGSVRRKVAVVHKATAADDKKLKSTLQVHATSTAHMRKAGRTGQTGAADLRATFGGRGVFRRASDNGGRGAFSLCSYCTAAAASAAAVRMLATRIAAEANAASCGDWSECGCNRQTAATRVQLQLLDAVRFALLASRLDIAADDLRLLLLVPLLERACGRSLLVPSVSCH